MAATLPACSLKKNRPTACLLNHRVPNHMADRSEDLSASRRFCHLFPSFLAQLCQMPIVRQTLLEMHHPVRGGGINHGIPIGSRDPKTRSSGHVITEFLQAVLRVSLAAVHGKHSPTAGATESRVFCVMVETDNITGLSLERSGRDIRTVDSPVFRTVSRLVLQGLFILVIQTMAAGDDSEASGVAGDGIEIESKFDVQTFSMSPVGMPTGVTSVEVSIAAHVIEVVAQEACGDAKDTRVVEQAGEDFAAVYERYDARTPRGIVRSTLMTTALLGPELLECIDNLIYTIGQQPGECQKTESIEKGKLLRGEFATCSIHIYLAQKGNATIQKAPLL